MIHLQDVAYSYAFQKKPALRDISFSVKPGEALLITGASGCGKSTLLRIISGLIPNHFKGTLSGSVKLNEMELPVDMERLSRHIGMVLQNPDDQFMATNVADEVALALEWQQIPAAEIDERITEAMQLMGICGLSKRTVFSLSQGEKQRSVLASVLASNPSVVVMDEPTANLSPEATEELAKVCLTLKARGITLVIVDHRLYWLRGVLDQLLVLQDGRAVFQTRHHDRDPLEQLQRAPDFEKWGLRNIDVQRPVLRAHTEAERHLLELDEISFRYPRKKESIYDAFSTQLPARAVTAIVGENGAGKTTLARLLTGLNRPQKGRILFENSHLKARVMRQRSAFVMQQMDIQLYMHSVLEELIYSAPHKIARQAREQRAREWLNVFGLEHLEERHPQSLSGGEKQRLVIACALMKEPQLLILDEPTSGLDGLNMRMIADQLNHYVESGGTVLLITHDLELLEMTAGYELRIGEM